mgnify:FL=1
MNGQNMRTYNSLSRREFVKKSLLTVSSLAFLPSLINTSCEKKNHITGSILNDNAKAGHLIRDGFNPRPTQTVKIPIAIVGAGISGLTTAYYLEKNNVSDFLIFDLASKHGGNSISDSNLVSAYPWAAHYLPIVNNSNTDLIDFLKEQNVINGFDTAGLPIYNEYYLCFDPEERLFINGQWQDGLIPNVGVPISERKEIDRFFKIVNDFKNKLGSDGKFVFDIPLCQSSKDEEYRALDKISFETFLKQNKFTSSYLFWYLNYCCKDDYGSTITDTSAYAGLHYFCARRAKASNADSSAILTWPEGNSFLANKLAQPIKEKLKTSHLTLSVSLKDGKAEVITLNVTTNECIRYLCDQVVLATPQYINNYLLPNDLAKNRKTDGLFEYTPWMVANITTSYLNEYNGEPLSWDNVMYHSKSLGYVNACHQHLNKDESSYVLTYYLPLVDLPIKEARKLARERTHAEWIKDIVKDLNLAHYNIEEHITNIDIKIWGHAMIKPKMNFIFNMEKDKCKEPIENKIFFAHTDLSGVSIFEEAFSQGIEVAKQIVKINDKTTGA